MRTRRTLLGGTSPAAILLMLSMAPANAQTPTAQPAQAAAATEEIIVSGTRVVRDGFEAPTPVTVIGVQEIQNNADSDITKYLNTLPSIMGSLTLNNGQTGLGTRQVGLSSINLRGLGANRTLVLLDGVRINPSHLLGFVDAGTIPQQLITRVDVVTGGASAAYGSDAIAGVVNFVLDKTYTGIKVQAASGISAYGDNFNWDLAVTAGTKFANDRGHVTFSGQATREDGLDGAARKWNFGSLGTMQNPAWTATSTLPQYIIRRNVVQTNTTRGGIISTGPLRGIVFGSGGAVTQMPLDYCDTSACSDPRWLGERINTELGAAIQPSNGRKNAFVRASYDITDNINIYAQTLWAESNSGDRSQFNLLTSCCVIKADNAFLPASVRARMTAVGVTQFTMGSNIMDLPQLIQHAQRRVLSWTVGATGNLDAFDTSWTWNAAFTEGKTFTALDSPFAFERSRLALAIDAVVSPTTGLIVCRSTLTNRANGCFPLNMFGYGGVVTPEAGRYVAANPTPFYDETIVEDFATFSASGEPFSIWAGPVSLALGASYRRDEVYSYANQDINLLNGVPVNNQNIANWLSNGPGSFNVAEGFVETVVPLAKDKVWARSLELNAAARFTNYSEAGFVTTWKAGAAYVPIDDIRFRATLSRDIREPSLQDLFVNGAVTIGGQVIDRFNGDRVIASIQNVTGNRTGLLRPEKADTIGLGVVVSPSFVPGFSASVDYFRINVKDAIASVSQQQVMDLCFDTASPQFCSAINRITVSGVASLKIDLVPFNLAKEDVKGFDLEASYRVPADALIDGWAGNFSIRALASRYIHDILDTGIKASIPNDSVGTNSGGGPPDWSWSTTFNYDSDVISAQVRVRGISDGVYNNNYIVCTSGCPISTANNRTIEANHIAGSHWVDASFSYKFRIADSPTEWFLNINNVMDNNPVPIADGVNGIRSGLQGNPGLYDVKGRRFRTGFRFEM